MRAVPKGRGRWSAAVASWSAARADHEQTRERGDGGPIGGHGVGTGETPIAGVRAASDRPVPRPRPAGALGVAPPQPPGCRGPVRLGFPACSSERRTSRPGLRHLGPPARDPRAPGMTGRAGRIAGPAGLLLAGCGHGPGAPAARALHLGVHQARLQRPRCRPRAGDGESRGPGDGRSRDAPREPVGRPADGGVAAETRTPAHGEPARPAPRARPGRRP